MSSTPLRIPYGVADFIKLRRGNEYYVDKTHYLPLLESAGRFLFLIRPRRFGKRAWNGSSGGCWRGNLPFPEGTCPIVLPGEL